MPLPAPNLDDRRFQDLVDDAKRLVQQRCPEWTDHNVHDPGVTLIELFAWMTDQLVYRLNRVPDRNYVKFLELIGIQLFPPTAASTDLTFRLSAPQPEQVTVPAGTEVSTVRSAERSVVTFSTVRDLPIVPCFVDRLASAVGSGEIRDHSDTIGSGRRFFCFQNVPRPDDALLVGLSAPVPSCIVTLRFRCDIEGVGVDPRNPPSMWEAWTQDGWRVCELEADQTGGLNRDGDVILHVPPGHAASLIGNRRAGWLRCRVVPAVGEQPEYAASPEIGGLETFTVGGTAAAVNAEAVNEEILGIAEGAAGQRFALKRRPVVHGQAVALDVSTPDGWRRWTRRDSFAESRPDDEHFVLDPVAGEVAFGPAVREPDGSLCHYGAVPRKQAVVRATYRTGGGRAGNVAAGALTVLKSSIPYVAEVSNRRAAVGGVDGEDLENAKTRAPLTLRAGCRAVTAADYEQLAIEAAPEVARVKCVAAGEGEDAGGLRVLVVPRVGDSDRISFDQLVPSDDALERIERHLEPRRAIGARIVIEPPHYQGITIFTRVRAEAHASTEQAREAALHALYRQFDPIIGGPDRNGWPFGRPALIGDIFAVLVALPELELVDEVKLFAADPTTGQRSKPLERIDVGPHALVFSYRHHVQVEPR